MTIKRMTIKRKGSSLLGKSREEITKNPEPVTAAEGDLQQLKIGYRCNKDKLAKIGHI